MSRRGWGLLVVAWAFAMTVGVQNAHANWGDRLFAEQRHDFGPVPRGVKVRHAFVLTNLLGGPVTILNLRASCGCTQGRATNTPVPPGESTIVEAEMDTKNFVGKKATTLYVTLVDAGGREAEVRLGVSSMILSDIVLNPGTIDFGTVAKGQTPAQSLTIDRVGMANWQVKRMVSTCKALEASLTQTARSGDSVSYLLKVSLKAGTPPGTIRDEIQLISNDGETPVFPIQVTATIRGDLSASPGLLSLGDVNPAGSVQGRFLVRGSKPFVVRSIEGGGDGFQVKADDDKAKMIHFITVTYRADAGQTRGDVRHGFRLRTDLVGEPPLDLLTTLHVEP